MSQVFNSTIQEAWTGRTVARDTMNPQNSLRMHVNNDIGGTESLAAAWGRRFATEVQRLASDTDSLLMFAKVGFEATRKEIWRHSLNSTGLPFQSGGDGSPQAPACVRPV